jgi:hypothetical protein
LADNVELDPGTGGAIVSTEEVTNLNGGAASAQHIQRMLLAFRTADGTAVDLPGDAANGLDVDVTRSALPTGASTSANQTTIIGHLDGVEGLLTTIDADTSTLAGAVSGSEMQADVLTVPADPFGVNADAAATAGSTGSMQAKFRLMTSQLDAIKTAVETLDNTVAGSELQVDVITIPSHAVTNAGTFAVQDSEKLADDAAFTVGTTKVQPAGYLADQASTDSVNEGDVGAARITLDRKQIVTLAPSADTEGLTIFRSLDLDETEEAVKASAGKLYGWYLYNDGAAEVYVKFYNDTTANVTVGTTTPVLTVPVPAGAAANVEFTNGIPFSAAITAAATTGVADADTAAPAANQVVANVLYQ